MLPSSTDVVLAFTPLSESKSLSFAVNKLRNVTNSETFTP
jgi:hypothetical protein